MELSDMMQTEIDYLNAAILESRRAFENKDFNYDQKMFDKITQESLKSLDLQFETQMKAAIKQSIVDKEKQEKDEIEKDLAQIEKQEIEKAIKQSMKIGKLIDNNNNNNGNNSNDNNNNNIGNGANVLEQQIPAAIKIAMSKGISYGGYQFIVFVCSCWVLRINVVLFDVVLCFMIDDAIIPYTEFSSIPNINDNQIADNIVNFVRGKELGY